jgi:hypothetical protein
VRNHVVIRLARKPWFAALLLAAFFSHALIPIGYMPGAGGMTLCSGFGPVADDSMTHAMNHDMAGMNMSGTDMAPTAVHSHHTPDHESMGMCPFAAAATAIAWWHTGMTAGLAPAVSSNVELPQNSFVPRGTVVPTRLPRGPPIEV